MATSAHFETLSAYQAAAVRIEPAEGEPDDQVGQGGGLADAFERLGRGALVGVLRDPAVAAVQLTDGDLQVRVSRRGAGARLTVAWGDQAVVDEQVMVPPLAVAEAGPRFRPDPSSERSAEALGEVDQPLFVVADAGGEPRWFAAGQHGPGLGSQRLLGTVPALPASALGNPRFREAHGLRMAYVVGAMAGGVASAEVVLAAAEAGLLGFYGAGGVPLEAVQADLKRVASQAKGAWGFNLLHNPAEPAVEDETVDRYLEAGVTRVSASAYMGLTKAVVRYRLTGIEARDGRPHCPNDVFAKISRTEVAEKFLRPAPQAMIDELVADGVLTAEQATLAAQVPVACCLTAEADSGGHTDHRPLPVLLPEMLRLRDRVSREEGYARRGIEVFVGAAGGLGTPTAVWGAFAMGADYVLTGSVNQATVEAGTSPVVKAMLAEASYADVASGPAPDMFEIGAKVQVLSRGSMYAQRAQRLYDLYKEHGSIEALPDKERKRIEKQLFKADLETVWEGTKQYWSQRDPKQVEKAERDPRHRMALTFRWYLGMTSRWARMGDDGRKRDFQIWCGPAMGAFNSWAKGGPLEEVGARTIASVAEALMQGAAVEGRRVVARAHGLL
jgi:PfaD family protein